MEIIGCLLGTRRAKYAGLAEGDAHVIRNAGGRASDDAIRSLVISYKLLGTRDGEYIDWLTIKNQKQSVLDDVKRIQNHALVPRSIPIYGFIYDVRSGKLLEVEGARATGAAT